MFGCHCRLTNSVIKEALEAAYKAVGCGYNYKMTKEAPQHLIDGLRSTSRFTFKSDYLYDIDLCSLPAHFPIYTLLGLGEVLAQSVVV